MTGYRRTMQCGAALATALLISACDGKVTPVALPENLFAPSVDTSLADPDNPAKAFRVDFARIEHELPLSRADRMKITPENLALLPQEKVDQIYGRITAGPIPQGQYRGDLFFSRADDAPGGGDELKTRLEEILGGIPGRLAGANIEKLEKVGRTLWKGKVFDREQRVLRNMIEDLALLQGVIDDPSTVPTTTTPRGGLLGGILPATKVWLLFPAKLHCGQSLLDTRRESVIIDYAYGDDIAGYRPSPDSLAGRGGLRIRDEIRMVRPGLYLGRAYANRILLLNFTLYNPEAAEREGAAFAAGGEVKEDCWAGEQARSAAVR